MKIRLKTDSINGSWWIFMHHPLDRPSSYEWNALEAKQGHEYQVTFDLKTFHLLKHPYQDNCKDYSATTEFLSHKNCIRVCKVRQMLSECGHLSHKVDLFRGEKIESEIEVRFASSVEEEKCVDKLDLRQECRRMCPNVDCLKYYYKPVMISAKEDTHDWVDIDVMIPSEPDTDYYNTPRIPTIEFLCYIASVLSLWFGFSILSLCYWLKVLVARIKSIDQTDRRTNRPVVAKVRPAYRCPTRLVPVIVKTRDG